jgi:single-strand DNA-binding protein
MMNHSSLIGRLTKDVDLRYTAQGKAVGTFTLAVNRNVKNANGDREADFVQCVIWEKGAENIANFTRKGSLVGVEGRIQTRNYENQQGARVYVTEVLIREFTLLESKGDNQSSGQGNQGQQSNSQNNQNRNQSNQQNFNNFNQSADPFMGNGDSISIDESDLPF